MQGGDEEMQSTRLPRACKRKAQAETPPKREIKAATRSSPRQATPKDANEVTYTVADSSVFNFCYGQSPVPWGDPEIPIATPAIPPVTSLSPGARYKLAPVARTLPPQNKDERLETFRRMCREDRDAIQYLVYSENTGAAAGAIDNRSSTSSPKPSTSKSK